ncbi:hypothetical protein SCHIN_v1c11910 [Spiroplasma chinense]|uniref:Lipoprotein n=1 Tax=Spiroplasma chinense TaxID=216932 RepID=A0A5B9Y5T2_9MOLU|nr:hypothetical protein [Spiroplasma chinense]QEH62384.1 hypothetical protein SCHIN_v1c11910 [Spiroplasma chinense]
MKKILTIMGLTLSVSTTTNFVVACKESSQTSYNLSNVSKFKFFANQKRVDLETTLHKNLVALTGLSLELVQEAFEITYEDTGNAQDYLKAEEIIKIQSTKKTKNIKGKGEIKVSKFQMRDLEGFSQDDPDFFAGKTWKSVKKAIKNKLTLGFQREVELGVNYEIVKEEGTLIESETGELIITGDKTITINSIENDHNFFTGMFAVKTQKYNLADIDFGEIKAGLKKEVAEKEIIKKIELLDWGVEYNVDYSIKFGWSGKYLAPREQITIVTTNESYKLRGLQIIEIEWEKLPYDSYAFDLSWILFPFLRHEYIYRGQKMDEARKYLVELLKESEPNAIENIDFVISHNDSIYGDDYLGKRVEIYAIKGSKFMYGQKTFSSDLSFIHANDSQRYLPEKLTYEEIEKKVIEWVHKIVEIAEIDIDFYIDVWSADMQGDHFMKGSLFIVRPTENSRFFDSRSNFKINIT